MPTSLKYHIREHSTSWSKRSEYESIGKAGPRETLCEAHFLNRETRMPPLSRVTQKEENSPRSLVHPTPHYLMSMRAIFASMSSCAALDAKRQRLFGDYLQLQSEAHGSASRICIHLLVLMNREVVSDSHGESQQFAFRVDRKGSVLARRRLTWRSPRLADLPQASHGPRPPHPLLTDTILFQEPLGLLNLGTLFTMLFPLEHSCCFR